MAYNAKSLVTDRNNKPVPQYYNPTTDQYEVIVGSHGANSFIERGRIIKDAFNGSSTVTKNYQTKMYGFAIVNDGESDLTISINSFNIVVKSGESFDDLFDPFTTVTISGNSAYRAVVRE